MDGSESLAHLVQINLTKGQIEKKSANRQSKTELQDGARFSRHRISFPIRETKKRHRRDAVDAEKIQVEVKVEDGRYDPASTASFLSSEYFFGSNDSEACVTLAAKDNEKFDITQMES